MLQANISLGKQNIDDGEYGAGYLRQNRYVSC